MEEEDGITITVRCRVTGCGHAKTFPPENPNDLLTVLEREGWRFVQRGRKSLPVCPKKHVNQERGG